MERGNNNYSGLFEVVKRLAINYGKPLILFPLSLAEFSYPSYLPMTNEALVEPKPKLLERAVRMFALRAPSPT